MSEARKGLRRFPDMQFVPDRESFLMSICKGKRVLNLGCGDAIAFSDRIQRGRHLHRLLGEVSETLYGVDLHANTIQKLRDEYGVDNLHVADVERLDIDFGTDFDVIVAGELIEHVNNPGLFLESVSRYMSATTRFVITTPNLHGLKVFIYGLVGRQRIPPDHSLGFSFKMLNEILERHGFYVEKWYTSVERFISRRNDLANSVFHVLFKMSPKHADTMIAVIRKRDNA